MILLRNQSEATMNMYHYVSSTPWVLIYFFYKGLHTEQTRQKFQIGIFALFKDEHSVIK